MCSDLRVTLNSLDKATHFKLETKVLRSAAEKIQRTQTLHSGIIPESY